MMCRVGWEVLVVALAGGLLAGDDHPLAGGVGLAGGDRDHLAAVRDVACGELRVAGGADGGLLGLRAGLSE